MAENNPAKPLVLVIDDDESIRLIVSHTIGENFEIATFGSGLEALAFLQKGNIPDLIVQDLSMPGIDGLQLLHQLKSSTFFKGIPVIILSAEDKTDTRVKCLDAGADDYLVKPFNPQELEARIRAVLKRTGKQFAN